MSTLFDLLTHYLNICWHFVKSTLKPRWNLDQSAWHIHTVKILLWRNGNSSQVLPYALTKVSVLQIHA